jgi:hypothetical protein
VYLLAFPDSYVARRLGNGWSGWPGKGVGRVPGVVQRLEMREFGVYFRGLSTGSWFTVCAMGSRLPASSAARQPPDRS